MDYLREGIHLRGFAQIDPLVAYKNEAFTLFTDLMNTIWARLRADDLPRRGRGRRPTAGARRALTRRSAPGSSTRARQRDLLRRRRQPPAERAGRLRPPAAAVAGTEEHADGEGESLPVVEQRRVDEREQIGRNDPCWCGSGKKYKKCHGAIAASRRPWLRPRSLVCRAHVAPCVLASDTIPGSEVGGIKTAARHILARWQSRRPPAPRGDPRAARRRCWTSTDPDALRRARAARSSRRWARPASGTTRSGRRRSRPSTRGSRGGSSRSRSLRARRRRPRRRSPSSPRRTSRSPASSTSSSPRVEARLVGARARAPVLRPLRPRRRARHRQRRRRRHRRPGLGRDGPADGDALGRAARLQGRAARGSARGRRPASSRPRSASRARTPTASTAPRRAFTGSCG